MDDHNVHHFWGVSPALDLLGTPGLQLPASSDQSWAFLQVCPYDCRHTLATLRAWAASPSPRPALQLHVYEEHPEALARHILLLYVLLDPSLPPRERCEMFLELHGNALLRQKTADYLYAASKLLEDAIVAAANSSSSSARRSAQPGVDQAAAVVALFDLSCLKYRDVDDLVEVMGSYRTKKVYDMTQAWDARSRRWYAERYDSRRNVVDWDYHMRLLAAGTPGLDPGLGSIIHYYHFRHWRLTGVAYELRDSSYPAPNTSLLSRAQGRTKEFKDRFGKDVGRSVAATGYWANILDPPYTSFGISTDDPALLKQTNKQFSHSSVDVAEHNLLAILAALRGESAAASSSSGSSSSSGDMFAGNGAGGHRARAARGPTDMAGLAAATGAKEPPSEEANAAAEGEAAGEAAPDTGAAVTAVEGLSLEDGAGASAATAAPGASSSSSSGSGSNADGAGAGARSDAASMCEKEAAQRAASAALDAAALHLLQSGMKITLHTGDVQKVLLGRAQYAGKFSVTTVGHRHVHLVGEEPGVRGVTAAGGYVLAETGKYLLLLGKDKVALFEDKIRQLGKTAGLEEQAHSSSQQRQAKGKGGSGSSASGVSSSSSGSGSKQCVVTVLQEDGSCSKDQAAQGSGSTASSSTWHMGWYEQMPDAHLLFKVPCT